mgnify:CR=1 FL=1
MVLFPYRAYETMLPIGRSFVFNVASFLNCVRMPSLDEYAKVHNEVSS